MNLTPPRQLDIFAQMVAAGNVARCARDMGISIEEVERGIGSLEMRLGYALFEQVGDQARLTPAGRKTAQAMTFLSEDAPENWEQTAPPPDAPASPAPESPRRSAIVQEAASITPLPAAPPRQPIILATPAPVFGHFQDALAAFEAANDDLAITLDLSVQSAGDADMAIERDGVDIAYFYALEEPVAFPSRYGWSEQLNLYAGTDHPLARMNSVSRADLATTPLLAVERHNGLRRIIDDALARGSVIMAPPVLETDNMFEIMNALRDGAGCFAAFGPMARDLGRMAGIKRLALDVPLPAIEVRQAVSPRSAHLPGIQALADYLFL